MSALRDNKVLIHNVYKYIRNRGMAHIRIGGKSNSVPMVIVLSTIVLVQYLM